jgi:chromate transporter
MVNLATYIGSRQAGFLGAVIASLAVVLPSFLIILLVTALLKTALKNKYVQAILRGLKPCIIGVVLATGIYMIMNNCFITTSVMSINLPSIIITCLLVAVTVLYKQYTKKKLSPILLIVISAIAGVIVYGV